MPNLLTCLSEPGLTPSCCEQPYRPVMSDCVLDCLVREQQTVTRTLRATYGGMLQFGTKGFECYQEQLQDMQLLTTFLYDLFVDRVAQVAGGNDDWVVADVWEEYDLGCMADYYRCRYKLDIRPWFLHAGLYDPAHPPTAAVIAQLPIPYEVPCGTTVPVPPDPDPPLEQDCIIPTFMVVEGAVDSAYETSADPLATYLIVSNLLSGSGGWNDHVGEIAAPGNFILPPDPSNIGIQGSDQIYVVASGSAKQMFPVITGSFIGQTITLIVPTFPVTLGNVLIQISDGNTWETVFSGAQTDIPFTYDAQMTGAQQIRVTYTYNGCVYGPFTTDLDNGCGDLEVDYEPIALCGTGTWNIEVDIISLDTYDGGNIKEVVNGSVISTTLSTLGVATYGPYQPGDKVYFTITHPSNPACDVQSAEFTDPTPQVDPDLYNPVLFTQNTVTLVYVVTIPIIDPQLVSDNPNIVISYDCGSGDVEVFNGNINSFVPMAIFPQPSCNVDTITGSIVYAAECDVRIDAELDTYTPPGTIDPEFSPAGVNEIVRCADMTREDPPSGKFYIGGDFTLYDPNGVVPVVANRLTRLNPDGTLDTVFNDVASDPGAAVPGFDNRIDAVKVDSQNRAVVCGYFTTYNDQPARGICRILDDGTMDPVFMANIGTGFNTLPVTDIEIDPITDDIYAIGNFTQLNGVSRSRIMRIIGTGPTAGTIDVSYVVGTGLTGGNPYRCTMDPNGKLVVNSGQASFDVYNGTTVYNGGALSPTMVTRKTLIRIKPDGALDGVAALAQGTQFEEIAASISNELDCQSNGHVICVGSFVLYNGTTVGRIVRLKADGSIDGTFNFGGAGFSGQALSVVVMPGGQILVGSALGATYNGVPQLCMSRLLSDGTPDPSFSIGPTGFNSTVYCAVIDPLGGVIIGGQFTDFNGTTVNRIARMP